MCDIKKVDKNCLYIELTDIENSVYCWLEKNNKQVLLKFHIDNFLEQRKDQRDYDALQDLHNEIKILDESIKLEILEEIKQITEKLRNNKGIVDNG